MDRACLPYLLTRSYEWFVAEDVLLQSRHSVERVEGLLDDLAVSVRWSLEVAHVDVTTQVPPVTERRPCRYPVLDVRVAVVPHLQSKYAQFYVHR